MPLVLREEGPRYCPRIVCDHCGTEIARAADGNYQWRAADGPMMMYFTHKRCCRAFEAAQDDGRGWMAIDLTALPYYLANNLKVSWKESRAVGTLCAR